MSWLGLGRKKAEPAAPARRGGAAASQPAPSREPAQASESELSRLADSLGPEYYDPEYDPVRKVLVRVFGF